MTTDALPPEAITAAGNALRQQWRICVYQRTPDGWALRLIHPKCPRHGGGTTWKAVT